MPPALKHESVVVRLVEDVEVKGVNADSEPPLLKEGAVPGILPVVEEPEANALIIKGDLEVNLPANHDNYPGLLVRILRMFWRYPCK